MTFYFLTSRKDLSSSKWDSSGAAPTTRNLSSSVSSILLPSLEHLKENQKYKNKTKIK